MLWVAPRTVRPYHDARNFGRVDAIAASMRLHGWIGRPILAECIVHRALRGIVRFQAWTAAHRIAAARRMRIDVPIQLVSDTRLSSATLEGRPLMRRQGAYLFALPVKWYDDDRMRFLLSIGDVSSANLLRAEVTENAAEDRAKAWKRGKSWLVSQRDDGDE